MWGLGGHRDILNHIFQYLSIFILYIYIHLFIMGYNFTNQSADPAHFLLTRWQSFIIETKAKPHKLCDLRNESSGLVSFFLGSKSWDARRKLVIYQRTIYQLTYQLTIYYIYIYIISYHIISSYFWCLKVPRCVKQCWIVCRFWAPEPTTSLDRLWSDSRLGFL